LFQTKYETFPLDERDDSHQLLLLQENFRSRTEILDFTNAVFKVLMRNYGKKEMLVSPKREGKLLTDFEKKYQLVEGIDPRPELLIYDSSQEVTNTEKEDDISSNPSLGALTESSSKSDNNEEDGY
jgi:ATP-dependent exoDNAse (exonuclease V) beta subunit